ncbi:MAG: hypothetical protein HC882_03725 [Acidobacteria bacterium]|nr:hypothetical protein [Acidobacteriota bacterium]
MRTLALAALVALCGIGLGWSNTGWRLDYDFPGQGADWYGTTRYELDRDFGAPPAAIASDGDDFGQGYDALFDHFGYGPPALLTNKSEYEYIFRFGSRLSEGFKCFTDAQCDDGRFCNGVERCSPTTNTCRAGRAPDCFDGNPCTSDACSDALAACVFDELGRAPEVASMRVDRYGPDPRFARIEWDSDPSHEYFNLYVAEAPLPSRFRCLDSRIPGLETLDDGRLPEPGAFFSYLVSAFGCGGESILGAGSNGKEQPFEPCP